MFAKGTRVALLVSLSIAISACSDGPNGPPPDEQHLLGKELTVYNYPLSQPILNKVAVHTYPVAYEDDGTRHAWKALGGDSGGSVLADTTTTCQDDCIDIDTVNYFMAETPCIWPYDPYYAVVGVCWNATNRGLYYTHKTVHEVKFYALIETWFGTYGLDEDSWCLRQVCRDGREKYNWTKCLSAQKQNAPWRPKSKLAADAGVNPRIELFERYYGDRADREMMAMEPQARTDAYLTALLDLNIDQRLGKAVGGDLRMQLQDVRRGMSMRMARMDIPEDDHEARLDSMNEVFNETLEQYAELLTDEQYERLFNATKDEVYDIRIN